MILMCYTYVALALCGGELNKIDLPSFSYSYTFSAYLVFCHSGCFPIVFVLAKMFYITFTAMTETRAP